MERRRSPIPPPREIRYDRRDDRRPPPPREFREMRDRRRPRSISPPERYRRSPPGPKRYRREEDRDFYERYERGPSPPYRRSPSYRERYDERAHYREDPRAAPASRADDAQKPFNFKDFMARLEDDVSPELAQKKYQEYLENWWGSSVRAEFEQRKDEAEVRAKYDPRLFEKALVKRNDEAKDAARQFFADLDSGKLDPTASNWNQGNGDAHIDAMEVQTEGEKDAKAGSTPIAKLAPSVCWRPARVAADSKLSKKLIAVLDAEKGIDSNPLLLAKTDMMGEQDGAGDGSGTAIVLAAIDAEKLPVDEGSTAALTGKLDQQLTYLWRVHGVDYYAGRELDAEEFEKRVSSGRMLRGPCPEEGEEGDAEADKKAEQQLQKEAGEVWEARLASGDPLERKCMRETVDAEVEKWVEAQVIKHADNKWGSYLSEKLFVGQKFVVKHIKTKHLSAVQAQRDKILDDMFFTNFKAAKDAEERAAREQQAAAQAAAQRQHSAAMAARQAQQAAMYNGMHKAGGAGAMGPEDNFEGGGEEGYGYDGEGDGEEWGGESFVPPRPPPRHFPRVGMRGGGRGPRGGGGRMRGMMDGTMLPVMPGMPPVAPLLVPAPGAGPLGPFIIAPMPSGGPPPVVMDVDGMPLPPRRNGPRGMRGRGPRPPPMPFPVFIPAGMGGEMEGKRKYYDLDAPQNNRAVLDYGDL